MEYQLNTTLNELDTYELNVNLPVQDEYTANLVVDFRPSKTSELINDSGFITSSYVGNGALTIQKNGVTIGTFTANQSTNQTVNIEADTQVNADWTATSGVAEILHKPDLTIYATNTALNEGLATKQNIISDLNDIRAGADLGATALQPNDNITKLTNNAGYITTSALSGYATETYVNNHHDTTKYDASNPSGFITGINSSDVTTALGYTPYNSTNPNGYQTASQVNTTVTSYHDSTKYDASNPNGYTSNNGTVTSVAVKMNGSTKGTVTTSGTIDLGTVITSHQDISGKENTSNKVTSISSSSTDTQYPSAKCVYDIVGNIESVLDTIRGV